MTKFIMAISFLCGNFGYQWFFDQPNYSVAMDRSYFQAVAMLFIVWYPEIIKTRSKA